MASSSMLSSPKFFERASLLFVGLVARSIVMIWAGGFSSRGVPAGVMASLEKDHVQPEIAEAPSTCSLMASCARRRICLPKGSPPEPLVAGRRSLRPRTSR